MIKIWLKTHDLTHGRNIFGLPIHYDGLLRGILETPEIDIYPDYMLGSIERQSPPNDERIKVIFGDFTKYSEEEIAGSIIYTPIHATELPQEWVEKINKSVAFVTASYGVSKYHREMGKINVPIFTWLPGVSDNFQYYNRNYDSTPFIFLQVSVIQWRKGTHLTCEAFVRAFKNNENVLLILQTPGESDMLVGLRDKYKNEPRIIFIVCPLPNEKMQSIYQMGHCFVYPSMDGPGFTLLEAMKTGLPSLVTDINNMKDVFNADFGWMLNTEKMDNYMQSSIDSLIENMQISYFNRNLSYRKGFLASQYVTENLTWKACAMSALRTFEELGIK